MYFAVFLLCISLAEIVLLSGEEDWIRGLATSAGQLGPCSTYRAQQSRAQWKATQHFLSDLLLQAVVQPVAAHPAVYQAVHRAVP
jgi:hypothetical protein